MVATDNQIWPPPPQIPSIAELPTAPKCAWPRSVWEWLPAIVSTGSGIEFWRLGWFDGEDGKIYMGYDFFLPYAVGFCCAAMLLGSYFGYRNRSRLAGKLAMAVPFASVLMFLPYVVYFYKWKDLQWWPW